MKKIKFLISVVVLLLIFNLLNAKENSVKTIPEKPKAGDEITIIYNPANTVMSGVKNVEVVFSIYSLKSSEYGHIAETHNYAMTKSGDTWTVKINTSANTDCIAVKFSDGGDYPVSDNNEGSGYFIRMYDGTGNEKIESVLAYATAFSSWATFMQFVARDQAKSIELMKELFKQHPELKVKSLDPYLNVLKKVTPDKEKQELLKKELAEFEKSNELTEADYSTLIYNYKNLKMPEKESELIKRAISKYPKGKAYQQELWKKLEAEKDLNKQKEMAITFHKEITEFGEYESRPYGQVLQNIADKKDSVMLRDWWEFIKDKSWSSLVSYGYIAYQMLGEKIGLDVTIEICEQGENAWKEAKANGTIIKANIVSEYENRNMNGKHESFLYLTHAKILNIFNKKEEALAKYKIAFSLCPLKLFIDEEVLAYIKFLNEVKEYQAAEPIIKEAIILGYQYDGMKDALKNSYVSIKGSDAGFEEYYGNLNQKGKAVRLEKKKKQMINQPAPQFTLTDLEGKQVSLSGYKGKVVVVDFWATWCGPCKVSFPAMQQTVNKYKDNKDVVFLFVNTWQTEIDKKKNAEDFIKETKYTFHVLLDVENKVVADYKVSAIPTKFIIGKDGNIKFNVVGVETGDVAVENLSTMIELASK